MNVDEQLGWPDKLASPRLSLRRRISDRQSVSPRPPLTEIDEVFGRLRAAGETVEGPNMAITARHRSALA